MATKRKNKERKPNKLYELPTRSGLKDSTIRVLAFDPGTKNFGISVVATDGKKIKVCSNAVLMNPMYLMTEFEAQKKTFLAEIGTWINLYRPNALIAERFMLRSMGTGHSMGELVPSMVALVSGHFNINTLTISAANWKVPLQNRFDFDLKELYKEAQVEAHQLDASFIGVYGLERGLRTELKFTEREILQQVENTSLMPPKNRRN